LLDEGRVVRIVDFGLAKPQDLAEFDPDASEATQSGTFLGTVAYAAPEQILPGREADERADQYSLGCVLYFMLTGRPPHGAGLPERLLSERGSISSSLSRHCQNVPVRVDQLWRRMVAHEPGHRFADMETLVTKLQQVRANPGPSARLVAARRRFAAIGLVMALLSGLLMYASWSGSPQLAEQANRGLLPDPMRAPFSATQASQAQLRWATYLRQPVQLTNSIGIDLVLIPPGEFQMGISSGEPEPEAEPDNWRYKPIDEVRAEQSPAHRVVLSEPFYCGTTEVTYAQFGRFVAESGYVTDAERTAGWGKEDRGWLKRSGYSWKNTGQRVSEDDFPVVNVSWNDAVALCDWLTENDGLGFYRLPTEAEWEFACRGGTATPYYFGDDPAQIGDHAWYAENFDTWVHVVAAKQPNPFGLFDLYGNRQEWCRDTFDANFYTRSPESDPVCLAEDSLKSMRGGAHTDEARFCTSARRWGQSADNIGAAGIRIVCELATPE
jgi:formylglycine-generating enzyme required for sulfatase activity